MTLPTAIPMNRRQILRGGAALALGTALAHKIGAQDFRPAHHLPATLEPTTRPPKTTPPSGTSALVYDIFDNHWALQPGTDDSAAILWVLPAQEASRWQIDTLSHLPEAAFRWLLADEFGYLWIAHGTCILRMDPHHPERGWIDLTDAAGITAEHPLTALGLGPSGAVMAAQHPGSLLELDYSTQPIVRRTAAPARTDRIATAADGSLWLHGRNQWLTRDAEAAAWQRTWEDGPRLPGGNHDLAGDSLGEGFVMAGGQDGGWGYPARPHAFDDVWLLDPATYSWRTLGRLRHARFYNGTTVFGKDIWVLGGNRRDDGGTAHFLDTTELCDPFTGDVREGPRLPCPLEMPVSARIGDRLYLAGGSDPAILTGAAPHVFSAPGRLWSRGLGESAWRAEPDAPVPFNPLAATALGGALYVSVPKAGLLRFDTRRRQWEVLGGPTAPRSPQITAFRGEIWVLGGRDIPDATASHIFTPGSGVWRAGPTLPRELAWGAAGVFRQRLMLTGGAAGRGYSNRTFLLR